MLFPHPVSGGILGTTHVSTPSLLFCWFSTWREAGKRSTWQLLVQYQVDVVLNGHDHDYRRWKPLNGSGAVSSQGVTEFVVGSGGHELQTFVKSDSRVAYQNDANPTTLGVLFLTLHSTSASFKYENISGAVLDSGTVPCISGIASTTPAPSPTSTPQARMVLPSPSWLHKHQPGCGRIRVGFAQADREPQAGAGCFTSTPPLLLRARA